MPFATRADTTCPAIPSKVKRAFCPGVVIGTGTAVLEVSDPVTSTMPCSVTVAVPVCAASGLRKSVYVPVVGRVSWSRRALEPLHGCSCTVVPSDFTIEG